MSRQVEFRSAVRRNDADGNEHTQTQRPMTTWAWKRSPRSVMIHRLGPKRVAAA
jgi:hypothetical protein